jgi:hypothetical protein
LEAISREKELLAVDVSRAEERSLFVASTAEKQIVKSFDLCKLKVVLISHILKGEVPIKA